MLTVLLGLPIVTSTGCNRSDEATATDVRLPEGTPMADPNKQLELLSDQQAKVRRMAAKNLGEMGAAAEVAIPKLEELAENDPDEKAREAASEALQQIRGTGN